MGIVLKARDTRLHRVVAIKVLAPELAVNPTARKRFLREAQAAAAVSHDHVVTIHAVDENETAGRPGLPYLVMEFIDGQSLQQKLDAQGSLPLDEVLRIGRQVAAGLAAAHAQGLIHRDIKPANILLQNGVQRVRITDFGLARAADDVGMTRTGEVTGTPQYMSPEQAQGLRVDVRSDLFSLGSVLYATCTGRSPFRAETTVASLRRVCDDQPRPLQDVNPEVPAWLVAIVDRLLEKDPDDRYQTAEEVAELLGKHLAHVQARVQAPASAPHSGPINPVPRGSAKRRHPRRRLAFVGMAVMAVAASLAVSEATGVTRLSETVVRIFTGEGTLVIEVDDPNVRISLDGEELRITGAGSLEIKLRPGQYQFQATKDGEPVKSEIVSISHGGRKIVRVTLEADVRAKTPGLEPAVENLKGAFFVQSAGGRTIGRFDSLSDAVLGSTAGDTIEIRGNGDYVCTPIQIRNGARILRAGSGYKPVLRFHCAQVGVAETMLQADDSLVMEGLELHWTSRQPFVSQTFLITTTGELHIANCSFYVDGDVGPHACIGATGKGSCEIRNCLFVNPGLAAVSMERVGDIGVIANCVHVGVSQALCMGGLNHPRYRLSHNTLVTEAQAFLTGHATFLAGELPRKYVDVDATGNVFDADVLWYFHDLDATAEEMDFGAGRAEARFPQWCAWRGEENLYLCRSRFAKWINDTGVTRWNGPTDLAGWNKLWDATEFGSIEGPVRFQGGDMLSRLRTSPAAITAEDFRLRPDSHGYQAGRDGRDFGADVDLVGPGTAYEYWKRTADYAAWRKLVGESMANAGADDPRSDD